MTDDTSDYLYYHHKGLQKTIREFIQKIASLKGDSPLNNIHRKIIKQRHAHDHQSLSTLKAKERAKLVT
jgi:hypothetical protein